ncbi:MAG: hypothetical protein FJ150_04100 [Euryarchaeota archaeon]|nr:hypothetical protein [Euryarchaeota archaeon]
MKRKTRINIVLCITAFIVVLFIFANISGHSQLGSDKRGYVTKDVYSHYFPTKKIAVVTGIHPREEISIGLVRDVIKIYALLHNVEITNYHIVVEDRPEDYDIGRRNGEELASNYILPDVKKSDYDLVIICHAHEPGYGEGFFIATPQMDARSVNLAEAVQQSLPDFNYYQSSRRPRARSSSAILFSNPLASAGYPTFVYEIPEWSGYWEAFIMTYRLVDTSFGLV